VPALTQAEAAARAALIDVESYDVFLDLAADPVRSRSEIRFRCREPGAATFADLTVGAARSAVLDGRSLEPARAGRLSLSGLEAENVLAVEAEVAYSRDGRGLTRFTDPADGATYVLSSCYPTHAQSIFCCFDQPDLVSATTIAVAVPAGSECVANGPVEQRPAPGQAGVWQFGTVTGTRPYDLTVCAGPYVQDWSGSGGTGGSVAMSIRRRRSLAGAEGVGELARFGQIAQQALGYYERVFGVPCPYPKYDIVFVPELPALAMSIPGLMLVDESLLARLPDAGDDVVAMVCAHEVSHLWFGCHVSMGWWDDLWLDEAMATYVSYAALAEVGVSADPWTAFCYREKPRAYLADELPSRQAVSSPVASAADALLRPAALTYSKGASVVRQLAALIGDDALGAGVTDYLRRFGGGAADLDDLAGCWSRASGRDLAGWADEWLRTAGAPALRASLAARPDGTIESLAVVQDQARPHRIGIGLYDLAGDRLRRRRMVSAEVSGLRMLVPSGTGEAVPDALVLNDGDLTYATAGLDERTLRALAAAAMDVGDQLTEAVCWNAAWRMVLVGELAAADFAGLVLRGLERAGTWPVAAAEVLLEWAVKCADRYAPPADRAGLRERIADGCLAAARRSPARSRGQRALAAGFAASAHGDGQLELLRSWLEGTSRPEGLEVDADLRGRILMTLSARGLASDDDLDALAGSDPVGGAVNRATCSATRPDAAAKEVAWRAALAAETDWRMAAAYARGVWVPGQETLMAGYRDRYFSEALPALEGRDLRVMRHLAEPLYPATLAEPDTLAATRAALEQGSLGHALRVIVTDQEAMMRSVLTARSAGRRTGWPAPLFVKRTGVRGDVDRVLPEHVQRDDLQRALVGRGQHHRGGGAVAMRAQPVRRGHAPSVPRHQPGEAELRHRRGQVVADAALMREELRGHHRADRVAA
jgi:aminopeptidase N